MSEDVRYMALAVHAAARGTCSRKKVGAVIANDGVIVGMGSNGATRYENACDHTGTGNAPCGIAVHAEPRAIAEAARSGFSTRGATAYVTCSPCLPCARLLIEAGVSRVVFAEWFYRDTDTLKEMASRAGVSLVHLEAT